MDSPTPSSTSVQASETQFEASLGYEIKLTETLSGLVLSVWSVDLNGTKLDRDSTQDPWHQHWVLAAGMTGSLRGINFDDYRPDLIVVDDPQTDETAATEEQRNKTADLLFGAVKNSLASEVDEPNAKLVMAITPQHKEDVSQLALRDSQWRSLVFPCWTKETMELGVDAQESSWPTLFPTAVLREDKRGAIRRNKLSVFTREMECRLTSREESAVWPSWLRGT